MTRIVFLLASTLALILILPTKAMALDEPAYEVLSETTDYELRRYDPYIVAEVKVSGRFEDVGNKAFRTLFDYISGTEISMTAPVLQQPAETGDEYVLAFVLPAEFTLASAPMPNNPSVHIREVPSRLVAARRYSGTWSEENYTRNESALLSALAREGVEPQRGAGGDRILASSVGSSCGSGDPDPRG